MDNNRLEKILTKITRLGTQLNASKKLIKKLENENNILKEDLEKAKKTTFEVKKQIEAANMANQLSAKTSTSQALKQKMDKYIREVDQVIEALKQMDE